MAIRIKQASPDSKARNIYYGKRPILNEVPPGDFEIIFYHKPLLASPKGRDLKTLLRLISGHICSAA